MEVEGVLKMFQESEALHGVWYKFYIGDGDSSSFATVEKEHPYGPDFQVVKKECVGHVQKRTGTRLLSLKKKMGKNPLSDGKTIGGKGRLTNVVINEMQVFYGLAIRRNVESVEAMKTAIWAEFFHMISTNEEPAHALCPKTPDTWCKYQKAIQAKEDYDQNDHTHVAPVVMEIVKPIFQDLSDAKLLSKCLHGGTQNPSESLNNVIWSRIPKSTFVMKEMLELGVYDAVACFKKGNIVKCEVLKLLGITPGKNCCETMKKFDEERIRKADKAMDDVEKKCRLKLTAAKRELEDKYEQDEDPEHPAYGAGMR